MKLINGIRDLVDSYDVFLLDMWGVMHNGSSPYPGVFETIQQLKKHNKRLVILSNSSRRMENSLRMLNKLGFDPNDFDLVITSGEVAHQMLSSTTDFTGVNGLKLTGYKPWSALDDIRKRDCHKVFCFGSGDGDQVYCESCGWTLAPLNQASLIVARGTFTIDDGTGDVISKDFDPNAYDRALTEKLQEAAKLKLPMIVTNPDKIRPDEGLPPMPGKIGDLYEAALAEVGQSELLVKRIGKPFSDVYDIALSSVDPSRAIMIGDALETDITGGSANGISTVWVVRDGIHGPDVIEEGGGSDIESMKRGAESVLASFNAKEGTYAQGRPQFPTYLLPNFHW